MYVCIHICLCSLDHKRTPMHLTHLDGSGASGGWEHAGEHTDGGGLPGPVMTQQSGDLALIKSHPATQIQIDGEVSAHMGSGHMCGAGKNAREVVHGHFGDTVAGTSLALHILEHTAQTAHRQRAVPGFLVVRVYACAGEYRLQYTATASISYRQSVHIGWQPLLNPDPLLAVFLGISTHVHDCNTKFNTPYHALNPLSPRAHTHCTCSSSSIDTGSTTASDGAAVSAPSSPSSLAKRGHQ